MNRNRLLSPGAFSGWSLTALVLASVPAQATWSILAVDRVTGQIGIAGASCTYSVAGIGQVVPGVGGVVVQAMSNGAARDHGVQRLRGGASAAEIIEAMRDERFQPESQQYGVVLMAAEQAPRTYSGNDISDWSGAAVGEGVVALGNTLVDKGVVEAALVAFEAAEESSLAERLMVALAAGARAGGDKRCGEQRATSGFVTVFNPDDHPSAPYLDLLVYGVEPGGLPAVARLEQEFRRWQEHGTEQRSTRTYIVP